MVLLEPPAHNPGCSCVLGLTDSSGTFVSFFVFTAGCKASGPPGPPLHPPWNPWNIQLSQGTGQGVSMTFNAASRLRSLEDRSAALGSRRCELPGMHSVPKSAVLPYASGVGGLSRRLLNKLGCNKSCRLCAHCPRTRPISQQYLQGTWVKNTIRTPIRLTDSAWSRMGQALGI